MCLCLNEGSEKKKNSFMQKSAYLMIVEETANTYLLLGSLLLHENL